MSRYIDADKLVAEFKRVKLGEHSLIETFPTADVEEVRHGEWLITEYEYYDCSVCGEAYFNGCDSMKEARERLEKRRYDVYSYCPYCGAKMDGGKDSIDTTI